MLKLVLPAAALAVIASAAVAQPASVSDAKRQLALTGKAIGKPISCLNTREIEETDAVTDRVLLFHLKNGRTYRNDLPQACPRVTRSGSAISYQTTGRLCAIDIVRVSEPASGFGYGGCSLGKFVRYELPAGVNKSSF